MSVKDVETIRYKIIIVSLPQTKPKSERFGANRYRCVINELRLPTTLLYNVIMCNYKPYHINSYKNKLYRLSAAVFVVQYGYFYI